MANMYIQYTPIAPLNLFGRIDASVVSDTAPIYANQMMVAEGTYYIGYQVDILGLILVLI